MKKIIMVLAICAAAVSFSACDISCNITNNNGEGNADRFATLNGMLGANYSKITLTVKDTFDSELTLDSVYIINYGDTITVEYSVERLAEISIDNPPSKIKASYNGTATIENGVVTGGEEIGLDASIASTGLSFKDEYFENVTLTDMFLQADVKNASAFFGSNISCTNMRVYAEFFPALKNIEIIYTAQSGNKVEYKYSFTR